MSARVLNPVVLTELYKLRSPSMVRRNIPCKRNINGVKKDLFGPTNPSETRKIFEDEIEKHQETACKKWGFDFRNGYPIVGQSQYIWERVSFSEFIPEMYTLSRAAHLREIPVVEFSPDDLLMDERAARQNATDISHIDPFTEESIAEEVLFKVPIGDHVMTSSAIKKRQPKITEYMKERKRLAPTPKKISPAKRIRSFFSSSTASGSLERN